MKKLLVLNKNLYKIQLLMLLLLLYQSSFAQIKKIWTLGDGEKVFRDDQAVIINEAFVVIARKTPWVTPVRTVFSRAGICTAGTIFSRHNT